MVVRFYNGVLAIVVTTIGIFCALVLLNTYNAGKSVAHDMASDVFLGAIYGVEAKLNQTFSKARYIAISTAKSESVSEEIVLDGINHESLDTIIPLLLQNQAIYSIYFGHFNGDFLQVIATRNNRAILDRHQAPPKTAFILRAIIEEGDGIRYERWSFLDTSRNLLGGMAPKVASYDPRERPWYKPTLSALNTYLTNPYLFNSLQQTGITIAHEIGNNRGVLGVDLLFSDLSSFLFEQNLSKQGKLLLFDSHNNLVASSGNELAQLGENVDSVLDLSKSSDPMIKEVLNIRALERYGRNLFIDVVDQQYLFHVSEMNVSQDQALYVAAFGPFSDFSAYIIRLQQSVLMSVVFVSVLVLPGVYFLTRRLSRDLEQLEEEAIEVQQLIFDKQPVTKSFIKEIDQLGSAFALMKKTIRRRTWELEKTHKQLEFLVDQSISISGLKEESALYKTVLKAAKELSLADRAMLVLANEDQTECRVALVSGETYLVRESVEGDATLPDELLTLDDYQVSILQDIRSFICESDPEQTNSCFPLMSALDACTKGAVSSILVAPLIHMHGGLGGWIILGKHFDAEGKAREFSSEQWGFVQSFATQVANIEELRRREVQLEAIVETRTISLAEKEAQLRLALDNMPGGMFMVDHTQRIIVANKKYEEIYELPEGLLSKGKVLVDLIFYLSRRGDGGEVTSPDDVREMANSFVKGEPLAFERKLSSGRILGVNVSPTPDGGAVVVVTDITESKVALQLLQESEEKARSIIHNAADGIVVVDDKGNIQLFSPSAEEIFGYSANEVLGQTIEPLIPKTLQGDQHGFIRDYIEVSAAGVRKEAVGVRKSGERFPMDLAVGKSELGEQVLYTGIVKDISERKEAEAKLLDAYSVIQSSINYASRIQRSVLPEETFFEHYLAEHFIIWEPRDIVGGDIYWASPWGDGFLLVLGDCTGHGVPGAFMTLIFSAVIDRVSESVVPGNVGQLINEAHQLIQRMLNQEDENEAVAHDGVELGALYVSGKRDKAIFSGARFDVYVVSEGDVSVTKGTKKGIGYGNIPANQTYQETEIPVTNSTRFYMTTDGIIDQIGGPKCLAFGRRRFMRLLTSIQALSFDDQKKAIIDAFTEYQGDNIRRDDVALLGFALYKD